MNEVIDGGRMDAPRHVCWRACHTPPTAWQGLPTKVAESALYPLIVH